MRHLIITTALVLLGTACPSLAANDAELMTSWAVSSLECKGGNGASQSTQKACDKKTELEVALISRGYCIDPNAKQFWSKGKPQNDWGGCKPE